MHKLMLLLFVWHAVKADTDYFLSLLRRAVPLSESLEMMLAENGVPSSQNQSVFCHATLPLYAHYPALKQSLARVQLGDFPTPVYYLKTFSYHYGRGAQVYVKRDDLTGRMDPGVRRFGGNKIRKLEFLLADALYHGAQSVMTYGCIGSNHATATAACAQQVGLRCFTLLTPQPVSWVVHRNLLLMQEYHAHMVLAPLREVRAMQTVCRFVKEKYRYGTMPYLIPVGGSNEIGAIGYVNAAFELLNQIQDGQIPMPDIVYLPVGSCGTAAGFLVGAQAAGIHSHIRLIAIEPDDTFGERIINLAAAIVQRLQSFDASFPDICITQEDFELTTAFAGEKYGQTTAAGDRVTQLLEETEHIQLDGTYSAKLFSGMMFDLESGQLSGKNILFWHTFCAYARPIDGEYKKLAPEFHQFF